MPNQVHIYPDWLILEKGSCVITAVVNLAQLLDWTPSTCLAKSLPHYALWLVTTKGKMHCKKTKVEKTYKFKATASADFWVFSLQQRVENSEICWSWLFQTRDPAPLLPAVMLAPGQHSTALLLPAVMLAPGQKCLVWVPGNTKCKNKNSHMRPLTVRQSVWCIPCHLY